MITEYIRYVIAPDRADEFHDAYRKASAALDASPDCIGYGSFLACVRPFIGDIQEMKHYEVTDVAAGQR